mgnify:CR=1 FL=1
MPTIEQVDMEFIKNQYQVFYHDFKLKSLKALDGHKILYNLIKSEIIKYLPSSSIVATPPKKNNVIELTFIPLYFATMEWLNSCNNTLRNNNTAEIIPIIQKVVVVNSG